MNQTQFLVILGFLASDKPGADALKKAYRTKCKEHHPDKNPNDPLASDKFKQVHHAYKMLSDMSYQRQYEDIVHPKEADLDMNITCPISFENAFFGQTFTLGYTQIELDPVTFIPLVKEHYESVAITVKIPLGSAANGYSHFAKGKGLKMGDKVGDATIMFSPQRHPKFKVDPDGTVQCQERVPLQMLLKGGPCEFQTIYGIKTAFIKPGTPPGGKVVIEQCGAPIGTDPITGKEVRTDHIVTLTPIFPTEEDLKGEAWSGLGICWPDDKKKDEEQEQELDEMFESLGGAAGMKPQVNPFKSTTYGEVDPRMLDRMRELFSGTVFRPPKK